MKVLVYRASSSHNVMTRMSEDLARALARDGVEVILHSLEGAEWAAGVARIVEAERVDWVVSHASFSADLAAPGGGSLYDALACGFVGWDVDHPAYQFRRFAAPIRRRVQVCASDSHVRFARMLGCEALALPMLPAVAAVAQDPAPIEDRPVVLAVAMSWLGEPEVWWAGHKGTPAYTLIEAVVGRMLADPKADLLGAWQGALADTGMEVRFDEGVCNVLAQIARFIRRYDRAALARSLVEGEVPCLVCGDGWRERLGERSHLAYLDNLDFAALDAVYARSKVVLNLNAANGASERAVGAMGAGALALSDYGPLLDEAFAARGALGFFDRRAPETLAGAVHGLLASGRAQAIADAGRALVAEGHLWSHRSSALVAALENLDTKARDLAA